MYHQFRKITRVFSGYPGLFIPLLLKIKGHKLSDSKFLNLGLWQDTEGSICRILYFSLRPRPFVSQWMKKMCLNSKLSLILFLPLRRVHLENRPVNSEGREVQGQGFWELGGDTSFRIQPCPAWTWRREHLWACERPGLRGPWAKNSLLMSSICKSILGTVRQVTNVLLLLCI